MAFYITKPGNPDLTILTDGGSLQIGTGLLVNNGTLNVTGEGVATDVFFSNILGEPTDNQKLAELLNLKANTSDLLDYIRINGTTETLDVHRVNFYSEDEGNTRITTQIYSIGGDLDSPLNIETNNGIRFKDGTGAVLNISPTNISYSSRVPEYITATWSDIINMANGESDVYAKSTDITQLTQKLEDDELVISSAFNDLNDRLLDTYTREESEEYFINKTDFNEATTVTAASLNDLNIRISEIPNYYYNKELIDEMILNLQDQINSYRE